MSGAPNQSSFDPETWLPPPPFMRVKEFGERMCCSSKHILNLVRANAIKVPQELQDSAPSGPSMRIPRASLVDFLNERMNIKAVAAANPRPKFRPESIRRPRNPKGPRNGAQRARSAGG